MPTMNGNIDDQLVTSADEKTVTVTGWIDFNGGDSAPVEVIVGISQGDRENGTAVQGEGSVKVGPPTGTHRAVWTCQAKADGGRKFAKGPADAGAVIRKNNKALVSYP